MVRVKDADGSTSIEFGIGESFRNVDQMFDTIEIGDQARDSWINYSIGDYGSDEQSENPLIGRNKDWKYQKWDNFCSLKRWCPGGYRKMGPIDADFWQFS